MNVYTVCVTASLRMKPSRARRRWGSGGWVGHNLVKIKRKKKMRRYDKYGILQVSTTCSTKKSYIQTLITTGNGGADDDDL